MNKKLGILLVLIVLVLLGGGAYVMSHKSAKTPAATTTTAAIPTETKAAATATEGTLKNLLLSGTSQECTFTSKKQATTSGTLYAAGGKLRGDFTTTNEGQTINGHMIVDSKDSYVWTDLAKRGMKIAMTDTQTPGNANTQAIDVNQPVSYTCKPWIADTSKFTLPADITFSTFTMPERTASGTGTSNTGTITNPCSACDSLPAVAQSACKTQLHCQ